MKLTILLMTLFVSGVFATNAVSQVSKITLAMTDVTVEQVMGAIEKQTDYLFVYNKREVDLGRKVTVMAEDKAVAEVLSAIFRSTDIIYAMEGSNIMLMVNRQPAQQSRQIGGKVTDSDGRPLPGVTVILKGTTQGTVTNFEGEYLLTDIPENATLVFSFVGMLAQEIVVGSQTTINVKMQEETIGLEEVVAVGYASQKKATITGAVGKVEGEKLEVAQPTNFTNSLTGRVPGLVTVSNKGIPGDDEPTIRIRGNNTLNNNSPLIVIDGVPDRGMSRLSAQDIESVTVLKDASAAIYGSRAANGVILITTKRGVEDKLQTSVTFNQGFASPTVLPDMAPSWLYATMMNEVDMYAGQSPRFSEEDIQKFKDGSSPYTHPNTDWFDEVFKPFSLETNANINLRGGTEKLKYFTSLGGRYQDATYKRSGTSYSQINFRSNIDAKLSDNLNLAIDIAGRQENRNLPIYRSGIAFRIIPRGKPTDVAWWFDEYPGPDVESDWHPGLMGTDIPGYDKRKNYVFESNIKLDFQVPWVKDLVLTGNFSVDKSFSNKKVWQVPYYLYVWDKESYDENGLPKLSSSKRGISEPRLDQEMNNGQRIVSNFLVNYKKQLDEKHLIKVLAGTEVTVGESGYFSALRKYFLSESIPELFAGGDLEKDNTGASSEYARMNYFGRINYDYLSKYLLEFVWRYDGSYIFPEDKRWGFFPGVSAGWVVSEEGFWKNGVDFIDFFKFRGSWGQTGNDRIGNFQYLSTYEFGDDWMLNSFERNIFTTGGGDKNKTLYESRIPNENITWEVANQTNIGFEAKLMQGKLSIEGDYFYNVRSNILIQRNASIPSSAGFSLPPENIGEVVNQGGEFNIGYGNNIRDFNYFVTVNGGYTKDKVTFWDEEPGIPDYQKREGHPMQSELYYQAIGIFKDWDHVNSYPHWTGARPGDIIFEDVNDDKKIDGLDRVRDYRGAIPKFIGGLNFDLSYRNFYATVLFQGATGKIRYHYVESGEAGNYYMVDAVGRWTEDNPEADKPRSFSYVGEYWRSNEGRNTYWLRSADYVRLKNMEIGYNMPQSVNTKLGTNGLRVYVSGSNLLTWCPDISDFDPESTSSYWDYPPHRVINLGVTVNF